MFSFFLSSIDSHRVRSRVDARQPAEARHVADFVGEIGHETEKTFVNQGLPDPTMTVNLHRVTSVVTALRPGNLFFYRPAAADNAVSVTIHQSRITSHESRITTCVADTGLAGSR